MTKLFKNSKSILSLVLAFAVLAVSLFTGVVINTEAAVCDTDVDNMNIVYYGGGDGVAPSLLDPNSANSESNPYIIATAENLLYIVKNGIATEKQYYKVADGIDAFVLQSKTNVDAAGGVEELMNLDIDGVMKWFDDPNKTITIKADGGWGGHNFNLSGNTKSVTWQNWNKNTSSATPFKGHFDGNGVTIYGMIHNGSGSLFGVVSGATIENLSIKSSLATGYNGAMIADNATGGTSVTNTFKNISVTNCCVLTNNQGVGTTGFTPDSMIYSGGAVLVSRMEGALLTIDGCYVNDVMGYNYAFDRTDGITNPCGQGALKDTYYYSDNGWKANGNTLCLLASFSNNPDNKITNSVVIGVEPWRSSRLNIIYGGCRNDCYSNVYTDKYAASVEYVNETYKYSEAQIKQIDPAAFTGAGAVQLCPGLDWNNTWFANAGEPVLRALHNIEADGHSEKCADCGIVGAIESAHNYVDRTCTICNKTLKCGEEVVYWSGVADANIADKGETGSESDPIMIDSAEELNYVLRVAGVAATTGKYYKIVDYIDKIVLQPNGVLDLDALLACEDGAAVKTYFDTLDASKLVTWRGDGVFNGNIDGNGVQIIGAYDISTNLAGFVGAFDGGKQFTKDAPGVDNVGNTVKGFTVSHSYFESNNRLGVFGAQAYSNGWGAFVCGTLNIDTCAVINCHIKQTAKAFNTGHSGIVAGDINSEVVKFNNLIVYGNDATDMNGDALWVRGGGIHSQKIIVDGVETEEFNYNSTTNSIILGAMPYVNDSIKHRINEPEAFSNVYTDAPVGEVKFSNGTGCTYEESQLKSVAGLTGAELKEACTGLDWTNTFLATADMPTFRAMHDAEFSATYNDETHSLSCSCGLAIEAAPHDWSNKDGVCAAGCGYACDHGIPSGNPTVTPNVKSEATCTESAKADAVCTKCGFVVAEDIPSGDPLGHDMKIVEGTPAKCGVAGVKDYYDCSRCDYVSEDKAGAIPIDNLDEWKVIPALEHTPALDDEGKIVYAWDETTPGMHYTVCGTCGEKYDGVACTGEYTYDDEGHEGKCTVCGIETEGKEPHGNFDENHKCGTCDWVCPHAEYVDGTAEGDVTTHYTNIDVCKTIKTYCAVCGTQGEDREVPHDVEGQEWKDLDSTATCTEAGELTQYKKCNVCEGYGAKQTVPAEATGHDFYEYDEKDSTCSTEGHIAYKECGNCSNMFAADAADDEAMENALDYDEVFKAIDPEAHTWVEYEESEADCDNAGYAEDHKFCSECYLFVIGEEATDIVVDWGAFYEEEYDEDGNVTPIGEGAIAGEKEAALYEEILAEYLAENGLELPEMPAEDASFEEWMEYYDARSEVMNQVDWEEFDAIWTPIADEIWTEAFHNYFLAAAAEDEDLGDLVVPALGHNLVKVDKVEATYDKEGTEAHWACENCDKLFADEDGAQEVTAEELVIAKLVKEEEKGDNITEDKKDDTSTADKKDDTSTNDKAEGDKSTTSPATGETVATVAAAVAAIIAAGFVLVRKAKKA